MDLRFWRKKEPTPSWTIRRGPSAPRASSQSSTGTSGSFSSGAKYIEGLKQYNAASGLKLNPEKVMSQARIAYHDSTIAKSIVDRYAMFGIGNGLFLEANPMAEYLGQTPEELAEWSFDVQRRFDLWARDKMSDVTESQNFYQLQHFNMRSQQRDGEYIFRIHYIDGEIKFGTFDPTQLEEGEGFDYGVHRNEFGAVDKYRIRVADDKDPVVFPRYTSNGKPLIIHGFMPDYSGQVRGISQIAHILQECKLLTDLQIFELLKAGLQASINAWVKPSKDAPSSNPFDDMAVNAGPIAGYPEEDIPAEPDPNTDPVTYKQMDQAVSIGGGMNICSLQAGEELKAFESTSPSESFSGFNKAIEDIVYASANQPPEIGRLSFNSNYSASQAAILLFWDVLCFWRDELSSDSLNPVYGVWLDNEIARGRIRCPGWSDPFLRKAWLNARWIGKGRPHIDAVKYAEGEKKKMEIGATTQERVARETNGSNAAQNRAKLKKEFADMPPLPWQKGSQGDQNSQGDEE
jgi:capsid protein